MRRLFAMGMLVGWLFMPAHAEERFATDQITVITSAGAHEFTVEIADTYAKRRQGLMRRPTLPDNHGMLFVFAEETLLSFWMKDTPLPLDLIFFDRNGRYVSHHSNAVPYSLDSISSKYPAQFVLEINGGKAEKLNIGAGTVFRRSRQGKL